MISFCKIVPYWVYFGQGEDFKLTTELSKKVQYSSNQAIKNGLNEAILLMCLNKRSFTFKIKFCVFQVVTRSRRVVGSNPIWDSEFFSEFTFLLIFNIVVVVVSFSSNQDLILYDDYSKFVTRNQ